jgi:hypothetical protein
MWERLRSRLRGHKRWAAARRGRGHTRLPGSWGRWLPASWGRGSRARGRPGSWPASGPGGAAQAHGEAGGRHRRVVTPGEVRGSAAAQPGEPARREPESPPPGRWPPAPPGPRPPGGILAPGRQPSAAGPVRQAPAAGTPVGGARARVRRRQAGPGSPGSPVGTQPRAGAAGQAQGRRPRTRPGAEPAGQGRVSGQSRAETGEARPWYELAGGWERADGSRHCGSLEHLVRRQWDATQAAPPEALQAVNRLAELPQKLKDMLATAVDAIYVGPGGVPELDEMQRLRAVKLPSGRATWDACAGAYGDRKIVVGTRPSPSPDVMCHEVGHAIDDSDAPPGRWQSDSAEFRMLYDQCLPHLVSDFHRQQGALGRREFFADAFAAIASRQRPALVDMLGGSTRVALNVMLFFNRRYGI